MQVEAAVDQVHPDDAQGFLLAYRLPVEHAHMDEDLRRIGPRLRLKPNPEPAVALGAARGYGVGKHEESRPGPSARLQPLQQQAILVIQHRLEPPPAHVTLRRPVDRVAHRHVVRRDRLGDRTRRPAHPEKPARYFLAGPDLRKSPVAPRIQVDLQRLPIRVDHLVGHNHYEV